MTIEFENVDVFFGDELTESDATRITKPVVYINNEAFDLDPNVSIESMVMRVLNGETPNPLQGRLWSMGAKSSLAYKISKSFAREKISHVFDFAIISGVSNSGVFENRNDYCEAVCNFLDKNHYNFIEMSDIKFHLDKNSRQRTPFKSNMFDAQKEFLDHCFFVVDRSKYNRLKKDCLKLAYDWDIHFIFKARNELEATGIKKSWDSTIHQLAYSCENMLNYNLFDSSTFDIFHNGEQISFNAESEELLAYLRDDPKNREKKDIFFV